VKISQNGRTANLRQTLSVGSLVALIAAVVFLSSSSAMAKKSSVDTSELSPDQAAQVQRAARAAKSGNADKARSIIQGMLGSASDVSTCLAMASAADMVGYTLQDSKRACLQKALSLCKTRDDYFRCALKARQVQIFDITSDAVKQLLASASSTEELLDLARRAQEIAMNDVSHLALEKAYAQTKEIPAAFQLAKQCRLLGADDLARKICREVIDDNQTTKDLIELLPGVEEFQYPDANRYLLKRALNFTKDVDDLKLVFDAAKRLNQRDIEELAGFRGRKMVQMQNLAEQEAVKAKEKEAAAANQATQKEQEDSAPKGPTTGF
jgi:hypothetical protein